MQRMTAGLILGAGLELGCGGGGTATAPAAVASTASSPPQDAAAAPAVAGPGTTTVAVVDGGTDTVATKLATVQADAGPAGAQPPRGAHTHDPGRGPDDIRAIVVAHRDEARACYDRALTDHPGIEGDLVVRWTIDAKGAVTQVALDAGRSQISEPSVVGCITSIVQAIKFADSPGGFETKASYPFNFHPRHVKQGSP